MSSRTELEGEPLDIHRKFSEWLKIAGTYPPPMREAARRFRHHKLLKEGTVPQTGVYYWIPLPGGKWDMMTFFEEHYGEAMHQQLWSREVLPYLAHLWSLTSDQQSTIADAYAGLPRGRVSRVQKGYAHYHGADAPATNAQELQTIIKREFGLPSVRSMEDDHERMLADDVNAIQSVLGDLGLAGV
jgi:hypothetical protein